MPKEYRPAIGSLSLVLGRGMQKIQLRHANLVSYSFINKRAVIFFLIHVMSKIVLTLKRGLVKDDLTVSKANEDKFLPPDKFLKDFVA